MSEVVGVDKAIKFILDAQRKTRVAASRAINDVLGDIQDETGKKILPEAFTLRGRGKQWWEKGKKYGFNVKPYSKPETLEGILGSQADWLKLQEHGGTKQVADHRLAIPSEDYKPKSAIMKRELKPRQILAQRGERRTNIEVLKNMRDSAAKKLADAESALMQHRQQRLASKADKQHRHNLKLQLRQAKKEFKSADKAHKSRVGEGNLAFIATMKSGFTGIFKRTGAGRFPIKLLFSLTKYARLEPVLGFEQAAKDLADEKYDRRFAIRFLEVMK